AVLAETAERGLLFDPRLLDRVKCLGSFFGGQFVLLRPAGRQTFERGDFFTGGGRQRSDAGPDFFAVQEYGTGAALGHAAPELRAGKLEIVSQNIEQRRIGGGVKLSRYAIDDDSGHETSPFM